MKKKKKFKRMAKNFILKASVLVAIVMICIGICSVESDKGWGVILLMQIIGYTWIGLFIAANPDVFGSM